MADSLCGSRPNITGYVEPISTRADANVTWTVCDHFSTPGLLREVSSGKDRYAQHYNVNSRHPLPGIQDELVIFSTVEIPLSAQSNQRPFCNEF